MVTGTHETIQAAIEHQRSGRLEQAERLYRSVLESEPSNAAALHGLGVAAYKRGRYEQAHELIGKAVAGNAQSAELHNSLGSVYKALGRIDEAAAAYERALELSPGNPDAHYNLGNCLAARGQYEDALERYQKALGLRAGDGQTNYNIAISLQRLGRHAEALEHFEAVIRPGQESAELYSAMAASQQVLRQYEQAISSLRRAIHLRPDWADAHSSLGQVLLQTGNFAEGWREYEWRLYGDPAWRKYYQDVPRWDGSSFVGKRLLVLCERGFGDNIQFVRYLPMVKARGGTVIVAMPKELHGLLEDLPGVDQTVVMRPESEQEAAFDLYCPIVSFGGTFGTTLETIPAKVPYIRADLAKAAKWAGTVAGRHFKVGIAWQVGSPGDNRSCPLEHFARLADVAGVQLYSLQKGPATDQLEVMSDKIAVINLGKEFEDFTDTAAVIENLDLVVSVDTSVLHLAGAMGKPAWGLLCYEGGWRWLLERQDSPWYPTMRLFREAKPNGWADVFESVVKELAVLVGGHRDGKTSRLGCGVADERGLEAALKDATECHVGGDLDKANELYQVVLRSDPQNAAALHGLGLIAHQQRRYQEAVEIIERAIARSGGTARFHHSHGLALNALGRYEEAIAAYQKAIKLSPGYAEAHYNMGNSLGRLGRHEAAVESYGKAAVLKPNDAFAHYNMAVALQKLGRHEEAIASYGEVIRLNHDPVAAYQAMASSEQSLGRYDEAMKCQRRALEHEPDRARIHTQLGMFLLQAGDFEQGWREYGWRLRDASWAKSYADVPMWDGSLFEGKRLLIRCEQGLGDNIQFARYVPMVKERGGTVILGMYKQLCELMKSVEGVDEVIASNKSVQIDMFVPLLELPRIFGTRLETVPSRVPYLQADPAKVEYWRARVAGEGLKVGIAWGTSEADINSYRRRCELRHFAKLGEIPGVRLYGLQKGATTEQLKGLPDNIAIVNLGNEFEDFSDTAAVVENMDLVISVDTSVLHVAGAMGKAVWAALLHVPDWRWMAGRDESPWYPTMRLFRQPQIGQWEAVFERMAGELRLLVEERNASERQKIGDRRQETEDRRQNSERPGQDHGQQTAQSVLPSGKSGQTISDLSSSPAQSRPLPTESSHKRSPEQIDSSEAMHNLALAAYQKGQHDQAVDLVKKAIAANPQGAQFHNTLGLALEALGRYEQALASYEWAVTLRPDYVEAYNNMAISLTAQGKYAEAEEKARKAIELKADYAQAYNSLAYAQMQSAASDRGKSEQAVDNYGQAIALRPDFAEAHNHLGVVLAAEGRWAEAIDSYRAALRIEPDYAEAYNNLGVALREQGDWSQAIESYRKAIELESDFAEAHYNLANAMRELGQLEEATRHYERAIRIRPDYVAAHWNYSLALLLGGKLPEGWQQYAWRRKDGGRVTMYPHRHDKPRWDGSPFEGKRLLVHYEQGFGDTIQFVRYLPMVKARGGTVILEERKPLIELLGQLDWVDEFIVTSAKKTPAARHDLHVSLMDLPEIFGTTLETIPAHVPYLRADSRRVEYWRSRLTSEDLRVGIVWAGSPTYRNDRQRSCPLELFKPVSQVPGVHLYGLQKDLAALQADVLFDEMGLINLADEFDNFADTAAVIENMDLVISVDTAVAHLAGAMGKAVWTLLPSAPDWRWMLKREDSPWYPTMRLFRQDECGEWQSVFERVAESLRRLTGGGGGPASPTAGKLRRVNPPHGWRASPA